MGALISHPQPQRGPEVHVEAQRLQVEDWDNSVVTMVDWCASSVAGTGRLASQMSAEEQREAGGPAGAADVLRAAWAIDRVARHDQVTIVRAC
jgi:hypothetical protein